MLSGLCPCRYGCFVASVGMAYNFEVVAREFTFLGALAHPAHPKAYELVFVMHH